MSTRPSAGPLRWAWSYIHPYRRGFAGLAALSTLEIVLRMLSPFAMLVVVDHALGSAPLTRNVASLVDTVG